MINFINNFRAFNVTPAPMQSKNGLIFSVIQLYIVIIVPMILLAVTGNIAAFPWVFPLLFCSAVAGMYYRIKPSVLTILPISYKRRAAYYYLNIIMMVLLMLLIFLVFAIIGVILGLILEVTGVYVDTEPVEESAPFVFAAAPFVYYIFDGIFHFGIFSAICRIEKKRYFYVAFALYIVVCLAGMIAMDSLMTYPPVFEETAATRVYLYFGTLPNPWLAVALSAVCAAVAMACSFLFVLRREKPKDF